MACHSDAYLRHTGLTHPHPQLQQQLPSDDAVHKSCCNCRAQMLRCVLHCSGSTPELTMLLLQYVTISCTHNMTRAVRQLTACIHTLRIFDSEKACKHWMTQGKCRHNSLVGYFIAATTPVSISTPCETLEAKGYVTKCNTSYDSGSDLEVTSTSCGQQTLMGVLLLSRNLPMTGQGRQANPS